MAHSDRARLAPALGWIGVVAAIGWLDYVTGPDYGFGFFYLIAVLPAAWLHGRTVGLVVAAAASLAWFTSDVTLHPSTFIGATAWNGLSRAFLFFAGAVLVDRLQRDRASLIATNADRARFLRVLERELPRPAASLIESIDHAIEAGGAAPDVLRQLRHDAEGMLFLAREFVTLGQLQAAPLTVVRAPIDVGALVSELVRQRADRGRISINVAQQRELDVDGDEARLVQALTAILDEAGEDANEDVRVDVERDAGTVRLAVSAGVPRNDTMLRPAFDDERVVGFELARLIAEAHGGALALFRRPVSRGLRVVLTLPALA